MKNRTVEGRKRNRQWHSREGYSCQVDDYWEENEWMGVRVKVDENQCQM